MEIAEHYSIISQTVFVLIEVTWFDINELKNEYLAFKLNDLNA